MSWMRTKRSSADYSLHNSLRYRFDDAIQPAIWVREVNPSLFSMLRIWPSTVRSDTQRRAPICLFPKPSATSPATSASSKTSSVDETTQSSGP